jgi:sugar (pentulose or hexulose) kinase
MYSEVAEQDFDLSNKEARERLATLMKINMSGGEEEPAEEKPKKVIKVKTERPNNKAQPHVYDPTKWDKYKDVHRKLEEAEKTDPPQHHRAG